MQVVRHETKATLEPIKLMWTCYLRMNNQARQKEGELAFCADVVKFNGQLVGSVMILDLPHHPHWEL